MARLQGVVPQFQAVPDVLSTSLGNIGAMFHPPSAILNVGVIESGRTYEYYRETMTPSVVRVIDDADMERMAIARKAGAQVFSARTCAAGVLRVGKRTASSDAPE